MTCLFFLNESRIGESRVAATPTSVKRLVKDGFSVLIEQGAGAQAFFSDSAYESVGAAIVGSLSEGLKQADIAAAVNCPSAEIAGEFRAGCTLISFVYPSSSSDVVGALQKRKAGIFAMEHIPRITRAQKCDALSSQSNIAGYQAALIAAVECSKVFPLMMTAAGTLRPARVVILGAGVAGLQAVATAKRLGAIVEVSDIRPAVKEQVESLGAVFIEVPTDQSMETEGGYAREATPEFLKKQAALTREHIVKADAVITSALVPGKKAPVLIRADVVEEMRSGSVIVDMAAEYGGNCELTSAGKTVVRHGVKIVAARNLAGQVPAHASEAYAMNIFHVLSDQVSKEKKFQWNLEDEIVAQALLMFNGERRGILAGTDNTQPQKGDGK